MAPIKPRPRGKKLLQKLRNKWTFDQRLTLHLLRSRYKSMTDRTRIFNVVFADHLRQQGFKDGMRVTSVSAQYLESTGSKPCSVAAWAQVKAPPRSAAEIAKRNEIFGKIDRAAETLGRLDSRVSRESPFEQRPVKAARRVGYGGVSVPRKSYAVNVIDLVASDDEGEAYEPMSTQNRLAGFRLSGMTAGTTGRDREHVEHSDFSDNEMWTPLSEGRRAARRSPAVVVPATSSHGRAATKDLAGSAALLSPPRTPRKPRMTPSTAARKARATVEFRRPNGNIMLTPDEFEMTKQPLVPPSEAEAHPPLAGLLFRYWTDDCFSKLDTNGEFVAGKFASFSTFGAGSPPLPTLENFKYFWQDVGAHMNREPVHSPWISTCNQLIWILRLAMQDSKKGIVSGRITILDAHAINPRAIFHAQPLHKELRKRRPFSNGAFRYHGMREFLIYHKIPKEAVLHTFTVQELIQLTVSKRAIGDLLRLDHLSRTMTAMKTLSQSLRAQNLALDIRTVPAIAASVRFFDFGPQTATEQVMHIVSDLVQGWELVVRYQSPAQWSSMADAFASALITPSATAWLKDFQRMKIAFLDGVRWAQGDVNACHKQEKMGTMLLRARKIGLDNPARIIRDELDAAKLGVMIYDQKQQLLLQGDGRQASLGGAHENEEEEEEEEEDEDTLPITPRFTRSVPHQDILYDTDDY